MNTKVFKRRRGAKQGDCEQQMKPFPEAPGLLFCHAPSLYRTFLNSQSRSRFVQMRTRVLVKSKQCPMATWSRSGASWGNRALSNTFHLNNTINRFPARLGVICCFGNQTSITLRHHFGQLSIYLRALLKIVTLLIVKVNNKASGKQENVLMT